MGKRHRNKKSYSGLRTADSIKTIFNVPSLSRVRCDMRRIHGAAGGSYFAATANVKSSKWHYVASGGFISQ
jgi:hypothetical protein